MSMCPFVACPTRPSPRPFKYATSRLCRKKHSLTNSQPTTQLTTSNPPRPRNYRPGSLLNFQTPQNPRALFLQNNFCWLGYPHFDNIVCTKEAGQTTCERCHASPTAKRALELSPERNGFRRCDVRALCERCWQEHHNTNRYGEKKRLLRWETYGAIHETQRQRLRVMLEYVRAQSTEKKVPFTYFINIAVFYRDWSTHHFRRDLVDHLGRYLWVEKVNNKYVCSKQGVDAMDFELWYGPWNDIRGENNVKRSIL